VSHEQRLEMYSDFVLSDEELKQLIAEAGEGNAFARSMLDLLAAVRLSNSSAPLDKWIWSAGATKAQEAKSATEEFAMAGFINFICGLAGS
jgi:hypothetical protein